MGTRQMRRCARPLKQMEFLRPLAVRRDDRANCVRRVRRTMAVLKFSCDVR